jgi:hypothetical protein
MVIHSSEGSSARKQLVVNVNYQSHRTLQHQDMADLQNQALYRPEPVHAHALLTAAKLDHAFVHPDHCLAKNSDVQAELDRISDMTNVY